jgi:hypothetical protein
MFGKKPWNDTDITGWKYSIRPGDGKNSWRAWITDPNGKQYGSCFGIMSYTMVTARTIEKAESKVIESIKKVAYQNITVASNTL